VLGVFTAEVFAWLESSARRHDLVPDGAEVHCGSVTALHRADSAAKLNLHFHTLALDGVYILDNATSPPRFAATPAPSAAEVSQVAWSTCLRTMELLKARGLAMDATPDDLDPMAGQSSLLHDPLLADCAAASMRGIVLLGPRAGRQVLRLGAGPADTDARGRPAHGVDQISHPPRTPVAESAHSTEPGSSNCAATSSDRHSLTTASASPTRARSACA
jgi:hypothetical protein